MKNINLLEKLEEQKVSLVRFIYVGNDGVVRGYSTRSTVLKEQLETGMGLASAMQSFNALDHLVPEGRYGAAGEVRMVPDLDTFQVLPYPPGTALMICDLYRLDRKPWEACPRTALKNILTEANFTLQAVFENEFYLAKKDDKGNLQPFDKSLCFSTDGMNNANAVIQDIIEGLEQVNIPVERYMAEYGSGQQEIVISAEEGLEVADQQVIFKELTKSIAQKHDLMASFMPKPFPGLAGNGAHVHLSLWRNDENVFYDENDDYGLSEIAYHFIAGILEHINAIMAFTAPITNSYRRLIPGNWASAFKCYGYDNREAVIRIPSQFWGSESETANLEFKPIDPSCNPYLALGAIIGAGLEGITTKKEPGEALNKDPQLIDENQRIEKGITRLPKTLGESLRALKNDKFFADLFGQTLYKEYIKVKESEWREYRRHVPQWEQDHYFDIF